MQRLRLLSFRSLLVMVPLALASSCAPKESGLRVTVKVRTQGTARVRADCIKLTVSNDAQELKSATIKRPTDDDALFGVRKGTDLPATVKLQASGYIGADCADEASLKLNAQGDPVTANFPESGVTEVEVFVDPPGASLDVDRDGFVAASKGGLDCNDADNTIFPGATQICANTADTDCDGQGGCDDSECGTATVCLDPPDRVAVSTQVATMLRYECRGPFRVELRNQSGTRVAIRDTAVALTSSLPGVTVHGTASCGDAPVTSLPILYGQSSFDVWLKADGQAFGMTTLTATADRVAMPGSVTVEVHPQPIDHLEFTTPARTVSAGQCSTELVTVEFRDAQNRRTDVDSPTTITMTSTPGDLMNGDIFYSDDACATPGPMGQLQPGQGELSLHVKVKRAGSFQLTATPSAGTGQSQALTVTPATGSKLFFANQPIALNTTQSCSGLFIVELRDPFDNPVNTPVDLPVRISVTNLVNVTFYEPTMGCNTAAQTDFTIPAGASTVSFRARGLTSPPESGTLEATVLNGAPISPASQMVTISAGFASKFRLTGNPTNPLAGQCSQNPFSVELLDSANNLAAAAMMVPTSFTLSTLPASTDPSFRFYAGPGCVTPLTGPLVVPGGSSSATFSYQGNKAVTSFEIRATSTLAPPGTFLPGNSIRPGPPGKLVFTAPLSQTAQAGTCTPGPYVANVLDLFDNLTSFMTPQVVSVSSTPTVGAGVTVGSSTCTMGNTVPLAAGATSTSFTAQHTTIGSYALTASVGGFSTPTPVTLSVTPGPSTLQVDVPTNAAASLMAGACQAITVSRRDIFGNAAPVSGTAAVNVTLPASTTWVVYSSNNCTTGAGAALSMTNTHTLTFSVSPRTSGAQALTVAIPSVSQQAIINFQVSAGAPTLVFSTPPTLTGAASASQTAGGCTPVTVVRRDVYGNDVPLGAAGSVTFSLVAGTTVHSGTPCTAGNAITTIPLTSTDASASFYVSATRSSPTGGPQPQSVGISLAAQTATLTLTVSPAAPSLAITLPVNGTAALLAHQCQRVNLERRDPYGNLVPASGSAITVTPTAVDLQTFVSTDCTGTANGPISVTAGASTRDFSLRLDAAGASPRVLTVTWDTQTAQLSLTISPNVTTQFVVQGLPATGISGACLGPITLRRRDAYNNDTTSGAISVAMTSSQFMFSTASDCSGATSGLSVPIADASAVSSNFYATAALVGTATMTATQGTATGNASTTISAGPPSQLVFTTPPRTFIANQCGGAANVITVQLRDAAGNVATAGTNVNFTAGSTSSGGTWYSDNGCTTLKATGAFTITSGTSSLSIYYKDTTLGTPDVSLTSSLTGPAPQTHTVTVGPPAQLAFITPSRTFTAAECPGAAKVITVQLQDSVGNPVNAVGSGQAFIASSNSTGTVTWYTDDVCTSTASSGAFTIPNGSNSVSLYYKDTKAGSINISLVNASSLTNPAPQSHTVAVGPPYQLVFTSAPQTIPALGCSALVTVTMQDLGGNVVNAGSSRVITFSGTPAGSNITFYTTATCGTALGSNQATMAAGASTVTMAFKAENAGPITLFADSPAITQGSQGETINLANVASLNITTPAATIDAGFCQAISVDRLDALGRPATGTATVVTPTLAAGALLFSDSSCTTALGSTFSIPAGSSTATIYLKGLTGSIASGNIPGTQAYTLTLAATGVTNVSVIMTVRPMVRRGSCTLGGNTVNCAITPTLAATDRTILFFQAAASAADNAAGADNVSCRLDPNSGTARVVCDRATNSANLPIEWQTVTFPYSYGTPGGVTVQHVSGSCTATTTAMPLAIPITTVTPGDSFVLFSNRTAGTDNDGEHFFTAQLGASAVTVNQNAAGNCAVSANFDAQVVSWQGATVTRGVTAGSSAASFTQASATSAPVFLLYSSRMTGDVGGGASNINSICRRRLRGDITDASTLTFTRGCTGADIQDISWETVRLPTGATVTQYILTSPSAQNVAAQTIGTVDLTRTVSFIGGQGQGGSASGYTTYTSADRVGAAQARAVLTNATTLTLTRGTNDLVGSYTAYVMQLTP